MGKKVAVHAIEQKPFMNVKDTAAVTGLSQCYLRQELKAGHIPHIRCGKNERNILINVPALLKSMGATFD